MSILIELLIIVLCGFSLILIVGWLTHISMVQGETDIKCYGWATFGKFLEQFHKYNWDNENWRGYSLWDRKNYCEIHANIVYFEKIGMIMRTPIDYFMMVFYIRKYFKENNINNVLNKKKVTW